MFLPSVLRTIFAGWLGCQSGSRSNTNSLAVVSDVVYLDIQSGLNKLVHSAGFIGEAAARTVKLVVVCAAPMTKFSHPKVACRFRDCAQYRLSMMSAARIRPPREVARRWPDGPPASILPQLGTNVHHSMLAKKIPENMRNPKCWALLV